MANTIKTVMTYPLDGSRVDFNISFEYLARKFITVTLIGTDRKVLTLNQDYRFSTKTTISLNKAWGTGDGYSTIEIRRYTSATDRLVDFADGSILRAYDLNIAQVQTLHVAEEARDLTADTIGVNNEGNLDARGRRIVNSGDAVDDFDVVNLHQVRTWNDGAYQSAQKAAISESNAKASESNAKASESNAKASESNAKASESNAGVYAASASNSNNVALNSATLAKAWASKDENQVVQTNLYSSYHYSRKAEQSATSASASESNAKASADKAAVESGKLGNMNAFAAAIDSVSGYDVRMKGRMQSNGAFEANGYGLVNLGKDDWFNLNGRFPVGNNYTSNGLRFNMGAYHTDIHGWEQTGEYTSINFHVWENSGKSAYLRLKSTGELQNDGIIVSNDAFRSVKGQYLHSFTSTGWFMADSWVDCRISNKRKFSVNSTSVLIDVPLVYGSASFQGDGNIAGTRWAGMWLGDYIDSRCITDMWYGGEESTHIGWQTGTAIYGGGHVVTGLYQLTGNGHTWIEEVKHRATWIRYGNNSSRIIGSS